jgi:hypothetical protein
VSRAEPRFVERVQFRISSHGFSGAANDATWRARSS